VSNYQVLFDLIGELARRRYQAAEKSFASLGLKHTEARLLALLHEHHGGAAQDELSAMLSVDRTNAGRALRRLEQEGYVVRRKHEVDKRANFVRLTVQGRRVVAEIGKLRKKMVEEFFGDLMPDEVGTAAELIGKALRTKVEGPRACVEIPLKKS
jgi:DNA-binding MarR family transcriptional regulator